MRWSPLQAVELFHLVFLANVGSKLDRKLYAVKGGCNLRFFFGSPRFSEDLDLDVVTVQKNTLKNKIDRLLDARSLALQLAAKGIDIAGWSTPKQTETTQRWKVQLAAGNGARELHTKIEFSRRGFAGDVAYEPVAPPLVRAYDLPPVSCSHYTREAAFWQKASALADRTETQARDVFDLDLLLRGGAVPTEPPNNVRRKLVAAATKALAVTFDQFAGQVLAYLPEVEQAAYDPQVWEAAALRVAEALQGLS